MSYSIRYDRSSTRRRLASLPLCLFTAALGVFAWYLLWHQGGLQALESLAEAISGGEPITDAISSFCRELLKNG